ncbi:unnamed protein product [Linum trigynum]|uniref:RIN4 pathogenic type III effector avirulence factor Avr cleavage site domain-containing protein n=1 Tax=Linum trigynum TaxID=586398 RepID=A0AAV2CDQ1_9ROSI
MRTKSAADLETRDSMVVPNCTEEPIIIRATETRDYDNIHSKLQGPRRSATDCSATTASQFHQTQRAALLASRQMRKTVSSSALYSRSCSIAISTDNGSSTTANNGRPQSPLPLPTPATSSSPAPWERKAAGSSPRPEGHAPQTPARGPPRFRSSSAAARFSDASDCSSSAVPKFGDWDEMDPSSADGYTHIFNRVREERHAAAAGGNTPVSNGTGTRHSQQANRKHHPRTRRRNSSNKSWYHCFTCF